MDLHRGNVEIGDVRMSRKLRVAHVLIQPVLVWDDGEELEPGPEASVVQVKLSELVGMADRLRAEVAQAETTNQGVTSE